MSMVLYKNPGKKELSISDAALDFAGLSGQAQLLLPMERGTVVYGK